MINHLLLIACIASTSVASVGWPADASARQRRLEQFAFKGKVELCEGASGIDGRFIVQIKAEDAADEGERKLGGSGAAALMQQLKQRQKIKISSLYFHESAPTKDGSPQSEFVAPPPAEPYICDFFATYHSAFDGFAMEASPACLEDALLFPGAYVEQDCSVSTFTQEQPSWNLDRIDQLEGGAALDSKYDTGSLSGEGVDVYIIDTGIKTDHPDFADRVAGGVNKVESNNNFDDCHGHGTHCAGLAVGTTYGVAKKANVYGVKVLDCNGAGSTSGVIAGLDWAVETASTTNNPSVISMSLGGALSQVMNGAVESAIAANITVVVAAGNVNQDVANFSPASVAGAITVGAADKADARASFSNFGTGVDVFAPGVEIISTWIGDSSSSKTVSGTSAACPQVAGAAALELQLGQTTSTTILTPSQVAATIVKRAEDGNILRVPTATFAPTKAPLPTPAPNPTPSPSTTPTAQGSPTLTPTQAPTFKSNAPTPVPQGDGVTGQVEQGTIDEVDEIGSELDGDDDTPALPDGWTINSGAAHCQMALSVAGDGFCVESVLGVDGLYENNAECEFVYTAPAGAAHSLVRESFDVEYHSACGYDWLETGSQKYCGTTAGSNSFPATMAVAGGSETTFKFSSDGSARKAGFKICDTTSGWDVESRSVGTGGSRSTSDICKVTISPNGLCIQDDNGVTATNYGTHEDCAFSFSGAGNLTITSFGFESHPTCDWDYLQIGSTKHCGIGNEATVPGSTISVDSSQLFVYKSDYSVTKQGFQICYKPDWFDMSEYTSSSISTNAVEGTNIMSTWSVDNSGTATSAPKPKPTMTEAEKEAEAKHYAAKQQNEVTKPVPSTGGTATATEEDDVDIAFSSSSPCQAMLCKVGVGAVGGVALLATVAYLVVKNGGSHNNAESQSQLPTVLKAAETQKVDESPPVRGSDIERQLRIMDLTSQV